MSSTLLATARYERGVIVKSVARRSFFGLLDLLFLPTRWMAENSLVTLRLKDETGEKDFYPADASVMTDFPEMTVLIFKDVIPIKSFIKKKRSAEISIALIREKLAADKSETEGYDIEMVFKSQIIGSDEQLSKTIRYTNDLFNVGTPSIEANETKQNSDDLTIWFNKEKIILNRETFGWNDHGVTKINTEGNLPSSSFLLPPPILEHDLPPGPAPALK